jgi:succinate dehydrogenase hydrophobic anchor subunit
MSHWIIQRASSVALLVLLPFTIFVDFRFYLLLAVCIAVHVSHGFDSIFLDYVHNAHAKNALSNLVKFALFASFVFVVMVSLN